MCFHDSSYIVISKRNSIRPSYHITSATSICHMMWYPKTHSPESSKGSILVIELDLFSLRFVDPLLDPQRTIYLVPNSWTTTALFSWPPKRNNSLWVYYNPRILPSATNPNLWMKFTQTWRLQSDRQTMRISQPQLQQWNALKPSAGVGSDSHLGQVYLGTSILARV